MALCHRKKLIAGGNNTDNYPESMINIFKSVILQRMRAYNLIELFKFITEDFETYFQRKLECLPLHLEEHKIFIWLLRPKVCFRKKRIYKSTSNEDIFHMLDIDVKL